MAGSDRSAHVPVMWGHPDRDADGGVGLVGACPSHAGGSRQPSPHPSLSDAMVHARARYCYKNAALRCPRKVLQDCRALVNDLGQQQRNVLLQRRQFLLTLCGNVFRRDLARSVPNTRPRPRARVHCVTAPSRPRPLRPCAVSPVFAASLHPRARVRCFTAPSRPCSLLRCTLAPAFARCTLAPAFAASLRPRAGHVPRKRFRRFSIWWRSEDACGDSRCPPSVPPATPPVERAEVGTTKASCDPSARAHIPYAPVMSIGARCVRVVVRTCTERDETVEQGAHSTAARLGHHDDRPLAGA